MSFYTGVATVVSEGGDSLDIAVTSENVTAIAKWVYAPTSCEVAHIATVAFGGVQLSGLGLSEIGHPDHDLRINRRILQRTVAAFVKHDEVWTKPHPGKFRHANLMMKMGASDITKAINVLSYTAHQDLRVYMDNARSDGAVIHINCFEAGWSLIANAAAMRVGIS